MSVEVKWYESGIGTVDNAAFIARLKSMGIDPEIAMSVDTARELQMADIGLQALARAKELGVGDGQGNGISVPDIWLAGQTTGAVMIDPNAVMVTAYHQKHTDISDAVRVQAETYYAMFNVTAPEES